MAGLNGVDVAILSVTLLSCLFGIWRGLIKEVLSLLTWVAALVVARVYSELLAGFMVNLIQSPTGRYVTAFTLLFIVTMMLGTLLIHFMSKLLTITGVIIVLVIMFITGLFISETEQWQQSTLIPYGVAMIEWSRVLVNDFNATSVVQ